MRRIQSDPYGRWQRAYMKSFDKALHSKMQWFNLLENTENLNDRYTSLKSLQRWLLEIEKKIGDETVIKEASTSETSETSKTSETSETSETSKTSETIETSEDSSIESLSNEVSLFFFSQ